MSIKFSLLLLLFSLGLVNTKPLNFDNNINQRDNLIQQNQNQNKNQNQNQNLQNDKCSGSEYDFHLNNFNCSSFELNNNATCVLCKTLVTTIDYGIIKGNQTIQEITQVLKDICCMIYGPSGKECVFVLANIQEIIKYISGGLTNLQICRKLHLC